VTIVKTVTDKGDKAALLILDDGSKPIWTPDRELARSLVGKPIPADWIRKDGEYGPQAFPPKPKGQGRYRDTKEAFEAEAKSRAAWQQVEEERKDRRTALMTAQAVWHDHLPAPPQIAEYADRFYEWLRSSPAAGPAEFPSRKASAGIASKGEGAGGSDSSPAGGTSSAELGEVTADPEPGEGTSSAIGKTSPGFPIDPAKCDHRTAAGHWVAWRQDRCPKCGTPKLIAMESGGPYS
jgi:hypothetical protein